MVFFLSLGVKIPLTSGIRDTLGVVFDDGVAVEIVFVVARAGSVEIVADGVAGDDGVDVDVDKGDVGVCAALTAVSAACTVLIRAAMTSLITSRGAPESSRRIDSAVGTFVACGA